MSVRRARLRTLAKINLSLRVLHKRADGYHELRTIFQTVSLADSIDVEFEPRRGTRIELDSKLDVPAHDNLITRAATLLFDTLRIRGRAHFRLTKRIPMGGGLGGGSSDAAAVLLGLPALAGRTPTLAQLAALAAKLGSDVPFFLYGGTALGIGRGEELYPLPDLRPSPALIVAAGIHISTTEAYKALNRGLTPGAPSSIMNTFQTVAWQSVSLGETGTSENDFESAVFRQHPRLAAIKRKLLKLGARPALMSGSGSALFGVFETSGERDRAAGHFVAEDAIRVRLVNRRRYQQMWRRQLQEHITESKTWPPQSRYAK